MNRVIGGLLLLILVTHALLPVAEVHRRYRSLAEGKYPSEHVNVKVIVLDVKKTSPRLTFLKVRNAASDDGGAASDDAIIELLLRERDSFLSQEEIATITTTCSTGAILDCCAFPEKLSDFDGPSFFSHDEVASPSSSGVCLHVMAVNVTMSTTGQVMQIGPQEVLARPTPHPTTTTMAARQAIQLGRMPDIQSTSKGRNRSRGGARNSARGGIFASWAMDTFGMQPGSTTTILDVAGGSGQLAFQLGVRRGFNITVVDPRPLHLNRNQRRTLQWQRESDLRRLPGTRDPSLPEENYGHHFAAEIDHQTWLVGGDARVQHLAQWFDGEFVVSNNVWRDCSVVLGMHPDEATEDIVDLALAHNKPFAVVPCCVFWKQSPHRTIRGRPVRTWEQYCQYLAAKDERIQVASLPFHGRNIVLYFTGGGL